MAQYRNELNVPVELNKYKFADSFRDRRRFHPDDVPGTASRTYNRPTSPRGSYYVPWHRSFSSSTSHPSDFTEGDDWFEEMRRRFDDRRKQWDEDVRRMRQDFFTLSPNDPFRARSPPHLLLPSSKRFSSQPFSNGFERDPDGSLHFVANFEVCDFPPDSVRVTLKDDELVVSAKIEEHNDGGKSSREYSRTVQLPVGAEDKLATATLSADGILSVKCPMKSSVKNSDNNKEPNSPSGFTRNTATATKEEPWSERSRTRLYENKAPTRYGHLSPQDNSVTKLMAAKSRFRLELPIDADYSPTEIQIRTLNRRIYITARHEERNSNRTAVREFSKEYDIPDNVDPECLEAKFENGMLCIEATVG